MELSGLPVGGPLGARVRASVGRTREELPGDGTAPAQPVESRGLGQRASWDSRDLAGEAASCCPLAARPWGPSATLQGQPAGSRAWRRWRGADRLPPSRTMTQEGRRVPRPAGQAPRWVPDAHPGPQLRGQPLASSPCARYLGQRHGDLPGCEWGGFWVTALSGSSQRPSSPPSPVPSLAPQPHPSLFPSPSLQPLPPASSLIPKRLGSLFPQPRSPASSFPGSCGV